MLPKSRNPICWLSTNRGVIVKLSNVFRIVGFAAVILASTSAHSDNTPPLPPPDAQAAADSIARLNAPDARRPRARIHAIGFPEGAGMAPFTNVQFSALMRVVTAQNDGTFVGITSEKACRVFTEVLGVRRCMGR